MAGHTMRDLTSKGPTIRTLDHARWLVRLERQARRFAKWRADIRTLRMMRRPMRRLVTKLARP
jgi:hypothetical protein